MSRVVDLVIHKSRLSTNLGYNSWILQLLAIDKVYYKLKLTKRISNPPVKPSLWLLSPPFHVAENLHLLHSNLNPSEQPPYDLSVSPSLMSENHTCHNTKFHFCEIFFMTPNFPLSCCWEITLVTLKSQSLWTASIWLLSFNFLATRKPHLSQ